MNFRPPSSSSAAIVWDHHHRDLHDDDEETESAITSGYWSIDHPLKAYVSLRVAGTTDGSDDDRADWDVTGDGCGNGGRKETSERVVEDDKRSNKSVYPNFSMTTAEISYVSLTKLQGVLTNRLRVAMMDRFYAHHRRMLAAKTTETETFDRKEENQDSRSICSIIWSIPIVVAIPEGPWLPLIVAAVHALNQPMVVVAPETAGNSSKLNHSVSATLIPVDPREGVDRLAHVLADCRPTLIVTASPCDRQRLEKAVAQLAGKVINSNSQQPRYGPIQFDGSCLPLGNGQGGCQNVLVQSYQSPTFLNAQELCPVENKIDNDFDGEAVENKTIDSDDVCCVSSSIATSAGDAPKNTTDYDSSGGNMNWLSHIVYTSGTTGRPKGCMSSLRCLDRYVDSKNRLCGISNADSDAKSNTSDVVLLASTISFDPCFSDILATFRAGAKLVITAPLSSSSISNNVSYNSIIQRHRVTHVLCTPTQWASVAPSNGLSSLRCVALGGERIPPSIINLWARKYQDPAPFPQPERNTANEVMNDEMLQHPSPYHSRHGMRLFATYGVTEACVYQTMGEAFASANTIHGNSSTRHSVGHAYPGISIRICDETNTEDLVDRALPNGKMIPGEVVLVGGQLDEFSGYLNRSELTATKFGRIAKSPSACGDVADSYYYRTGDVGVFEHKSGRPPELFILGRIGEDAMIKFNGVRVELGEIESVLVDDFQGSSTLSMVIDAMVKAWPKKGDDAMGQDLVAYVVVSEQCRAELSYPDEIPDSGIMCTLTPLLALLIGRCKRKSKVVPTTFVVLPRIPRSSTGKRYRRGLPSLENAIIFEEHAPSSSQKLSEYGSSGKFLSDQIAESLNLRNSRQTLLTAKASFAMLGGDSLAATRICRAIYATHHDIRNSRELGGKYGVLDGPFAAIHLLKAATMSDYVDLLDSHGICQDKHNPHEQKSSVAGPGQSTAQSSVHASVDEDARLLCDALVESTSKSYSQLACSLIAEGADPNLDSHGGRLGKIGSRIVQRDTFKTSPLHLACLKALPSVVEALLSKGASLCSPDASGLYPLHMAAARDSSRPYTHLEDNLRMECVRRLLDAGAPLSMKDGNKQTVIHAAARAGNVITLRYGLGRWVEAYPKGHNLACGLNWRDRWARTPVHWAVLNGNAECLRALLEYSCDPNPPKAKIGRRSSAAVESPIEICKRLYSGKPVGECMERLILKAIEGAIDNDD